MGPAAPQAGRAEMSRGEGDDGMAAAGGPPSPRTILIQMGCPLKGTAVSRLRECHCRFLLPGGPRCPPACRGQAGQASAARARPGPQAARRAPPANKRAPRGPVSQWRRVPQAPGTTRQERACRRLQQGTRGSTAGRAPNAGTAARGGHGTAFCPSWGCPTVEALGQLGYRVEPHQASALPGACLGTAMMPPAGHVPPERLGPSHHHGSPGKVRHAPAQRSACRRGGTEPVSPKRPHGPFLVCRLMPAASAQPVPRGCAACQGLCCAPGLPAGMPAPTCARGARCAGQVAVAWVGCGVGQLGPGSAAVPGGGRPAPVSSSGSYARRGEGPAHTEL